MSSPNQLPAYFRYLKARLQPFKRPAFWISSMGLLLVLLFAWEYWNDPEWFSFLETSPSDDLFAPAEPTLSSEELAATVAEIDSSSVLLEEFNPEKALALTNLPDSTAEKQDSGGLLSELAPANTQQESAPSILKETSEAKSNSSNPFAKSAQDFLNAGIFSGTNLFANPNSSSTDTESSSSTGGDVGSINLLNISNTDSGKASTSPSSNTPTGVRGTGSASSSSSTQTLPIPTNRGQDIAPSTIVPITPYSGAGQVNYPPATVPGASSYNGAGQMNYSTAPVPSAPRYNGAGQQAYPPAAAPNATGYGTYPTTPNNVGQYSNQPSNGFPNSSGVNSTPISPGLQPSQLNGSNLNR
ncbi:MULTISPECIES: hypothetical protein [unclassified Coleofasciculus]|uniref:hypothetical protein n=1 Tax=unclassified Coleofasciculus TaxID=2692782 RepID=UPI00188095CB|nr:MULTISPECIES: hypothetical protein [unclassified Coleofasciculus]MBE9124649.1 hypothetical protein [Coleofasciculus sp. LEGE 07081]MBE9146976.1 hypothetical protein [Coleofasciculus sp. LEGE 07092]